MDNITVAFIWEGEIESNIYLKLQLDLLLIKLMQENDKGRFLLGGKTPFTKFCYKRVKHWCSGSDKFTYKFSNDDEKALVDECDILITYMDCGVESAVIYAKQKNKQIIYLCELTLNSLKNK